MSRKVKPEGEELIRISNGPGNTLITLKPKGRGVTMQAFTIQNYAAFSGRPALRALAFTILDATGGRDDVYKKVNT